MRYQPDALAAELGVTLPQPAASPITNGHNTKGRQAAAEPVNLDDCPSVLAALDIVSSPPDRSTDTMRVVGACYNAGLTLAQTRWVVGTRPDLAGRLAERNDDDVLTCWIKATDSRQHAKQANNIAASTATQDASNIAVAAALPSVALTDKGNALALAATYRGHLRYVPENGKWVRWTGVLWNVDADTAAADTAAGHIAMNLPADTKEAAAHKKRSLSRAGITDMVRLARSDPAMRATRDMLDANPFELNTPNGIVDLRTGETQPHRADAWHTKITGTGYDRDAPAPRWLAFLHTTFGGDQQLIVYVQRLAGYAATGQVTHHVLPFLFGAGFNGKSVLLDVFLNVLGSDYAITAPGNFLLAGRDRHETEIARLAGARLVVCSEINHESRFD